MPVLDCSTGQVREHSAVEQAAIDAELSVSPVPQIVSARQIKLALLAAGLLDAVQAFVDAQDRAVQISWECAIEFRRDDPMLSAMMAAFALVTDEQADDLFRQAATL